MGDPVAADEIAVIGLLTIGVSHAPVPAGHACAALDRGQQERRGNRSDWPVEPRLRGRPTPTYGPRDRTRARSLVPVRKCSVAPTPRRAHTLPHRGPPTLSPPRLRYLLACPAADGPEPRPRHRAP